MMNSNFSENMVNFFMPNIRTSKLKSLICRRCTIKQAIKSYDPKKAIFDFLDQEKPDIIFSQINQYEELVADGRLYGARYFDRN